LFAFRVEWEAKEEEHLGEKFCGLRMCQFLIEHGELALLDLFGGKIQWTCKRGQVLLVNPKTNISLRAFNLQSQRDTAEAFTGNLIYGFEARLCYDPATNRLRELGEKESTSRTIFVVLS
jgi:hypothetical protein